MTALTNFNLACNERTLNIWQLKAKIKDQLYRYYYPKYLLNYVLKFMQLSYFILNNPIFLAIYFQGLHYFFFLYYYFDICWVVVTIDNMSSIGHKVFWLTQLGPVAKKSQGFCFVSRQHNEWMKYKLYKLCNIFIRGSPSNLINHEVL